MARVRYEFCVKTIQAYNGKNTVCGKKVSPKLFGIF